MEQRQSLGEHPHQHLPGVLGGGLIFPVRGRLESSMNQSQKSSQIKS